MTKRDKTTITFSLPVKSADWVEKLTKIENKTKDQLFEDMLDLYSTEVINRKIHEVRAEEISGKDCSGLSDEEIDEILSKSKGN